MEVGHGAGHADRRALTAGALKGVGETASAAVKDAYQELKRRVTARFTGRPAAEMVLAEHEADSRGNGNAYEKALAKHVVESGADGDPDVIGAAQALMALLDQPGSRAGKYVVDVRDSQGVVIGDNAHVVQTFGTPPSSS